ncbi:MAG: ABC transporter ATP-binding protein [Candidatus Heimdallarchaeota archaeon]|nr:ABC transporter ATP-binding protein [Candidatus Heimdallarchaeota archaeon]
MSQAIINIENITKIYPGGTIGIQNLSLQIHKNEIYGFLGQNGAGKTTTIRSILNILIPNEGSITVDGEVISRDNPEIREKIGYLPGELNVPSGYTVEDFITYMASLKKRPSTRMREIANRFELPWNKKVQALSKGNKQKMGIVLAFMHDPEIYILDEPTSGLDPLWQQELYDLILEEKKRGKTIFFSSHNLDEVQKICDRVAIIREGKLVTIEVVDELAEKITRKLTVKLDDLNENELEEISSKMSVDSSNLLTGEVTIIIKNPQDVSETLTYFNKYNSRLKDLVFPPASLEHFFLEKYRDD